MVGDGYGVAVDDLEKDDVDVYVAVSRAENHSQRTYDYRPSSARDKPPKVITDSRLLAMRAKLRTDEGRRLYAKRKQTVEPVFGIIKEGLGFRPFRLRGLEEEGGGMVAYAPGVQREAAVGPADGIKPLQAPPAPRKMG